MTSPGHSERAITLTELATAVASTRGDAIVVTGPGAFAGELYATDPESPTIYNMELAYAIPTAIGLAIAQPNRGVVAIDGDGSALAGLGSIATIARYRPTNVTIVIIDNGIYGTGDGSVATQTSLGADLCAVAIGLGMPQERVKHVNDPGALHAALVAAGVGPRMIVASVNPSSYPPSNSRRKPGIDVVESAVLLRRLVGRETTPT
jgi:thiamine pyrophosphate-dependent acetolactate synthase large subunit-like protein